MLFDDDLLLVQVVLELLLCLLKSLCLLLHLGSRSSLLSCDLASSF